MANLPKTMRGVALVGHGGPEMLEMRANKASGCRNLQA